MSNAPLKGRALADMRARHQKASALADALVEGLSNKETNSLLLFSAAVRIAEELHEMEKIIYPSRKKNYIQPQEYDEVYRRLKEVYELIGMDDPLASEILGNLVEDLRKNTDLSKKDVPPS